MPDQPWADGYVVDAGCTDGFYGELAPSLLRFVTVLHGVHAVDITKPFTYFELGCGSGYSTTLLAAANPHGQFFGIDFNPAYIHNGQKRADDSGVANVTFLEKSFLELREMDLPEAEIVALHGVYSWVNEENRQHIIEFIRRRLKPGGIVYISYNALPGLSQVIPFQRLLVKYASVGAGSLNQRIRDSVKFAAQFEAAGAHYFRDNPLAKKRLNKIIKRDPSSLAHEYYNASWSPFYHADVAKDLSVAKLNFVGSATLIENFDELILRPELQEVVAQFGDRAMSETIRDFALNQAFRTDVFTRGASTASQAEREHLLAQTRFALVCPRDSCRFTMATSAGELSMQEEVYAPVLDALVNGPMTFDELARAPEVSGERRGQIRRALFAMAALGNVQPALPSAGEDARRASVSRFNEVAIANALAGGAMAPLASPVLGTGVMVNFIDQLFLNAHKNGEDMVDYAWGALSRAGQKLVQHGKPIDVDEENLAVLRDQANTFSSTRLPILIQLGIVD